ncbi:MAG: MATE family efflux transporter [Lachnospiraceae bacterium]|jgi:O-antigen/teichoic acid export membrane protein|nr:MATE family efflux transporter [Lachnospiraceae bacterium]MCI9018295.1 MATE family efflux transporter [Lachnospiraceae bacterium]MCI9305000.1 MATE family efflux transporter [Lachnospiraceae bacterium]MCI9680349.1 MATE family efflux transporter [Lachnospiraceae bacterium]
MNKKRVAINMTAQLLAFAVNMLLGFILVPVIDSMIPNAYGFTDIANKFVQAAQIIVSALNTMASRFITIHIHRNDREEANRYFSSVFFANVLMAVVFMAPAMFVVVYLGHIFQVPPEASLPDIQMLFFFIFVNFLISITTSVFGVAPYSKDRLELSSVATILGEVVRLAVLFVSYFFFRPYLWYVGCASVASTLVQAAANLFFTRRLLPDMEVKKKHFRWEKVRELVSLGAWNSVTRLGQLLLDGLSTSIANIMISAAAMTTISISTQVPTVISNLMGTIAGVFNPQMTIAYAKEDKKQLLEIIASADRIMIFIISIPIAFMTVFGKAFFQLWIGRTQDPGELYILALLNVGTLFVSASIQVLYHVFLITKRVKLNSVVILLSGILTTATVFVLLETTDLGVYAIAGVSTFYGILRNLVFTPIYAARCLKVKWYTFYGDILLGLASIGAICLTALPFQLLIEIDGWIKLFAVGIAAGAAALAVNFLIVLRKNERKMVLDMVRKKLQR